MNLAYIMIFGVNNKILVRFLRLGIKKNKKTKKISKANYFHHTSL